MKCRSLLLATGLAGALLVGVTGTAGAWIASVKQYYGVCGGTPKNWSYV